MTGESEIGASARFDELIARFENAWRLGQRPSLQEFVARAEMEPDPQGLIEELVLIDLEWQWRSKAGQPLRLEDYAAQISQLGPVDQLSIRVLEEEYRARHNWGDRPGHDEYQRRFAQRWQALSEGLERVDQELARELRRQEPEVQDRLGRYRILERVGSGGFGLVFRARDEELSRDVAIKVPYRDRIATRDNAEQFLTEARTIAGLDHPNVVPVYDVGRTDDGICHVVSKFIDGSELTARIAAGSRLLHEIATIVASVADALHHAHLQGITHRDIKPANILLDSDGKAYVTDFGLAIRDTDAALDQTLAGTPAYMSPEQARGEGHRLDGRTDIFSLGAVLYECLTGRQPFRGESTSEVLEMVKHVEPRPPRQLDNGIPRELERICLKALSKRVCDRYSTAADMADDLRQWLASETFKLAEPTHAVSAARDTGRPVASVATDVRHAPASPVESSGHGVGPRIVPKGLRSFDAEDADFFLELLPGPRSRDGLPDSIRFWKSRIETTVPAQAFAVGMLYGPSGCGKSSLVKAGLLPRLADHVETVYIEATSHETEARLMMGLHECVRPDSPQMSLPEAISSIRRAGLPGGRKLLLVIDQFEQWLHAHPSPQGELLVDALRQCDGANVQCLLLVRDDFWLSSCRFMDALEIELVPDRNVAIADLFDILHARNVLRRFGQAYGRLPADDSELSSKQAAFIKAAVDGLARDERVVCVRLALFADLVKGKPWEPPTLTQYGGMHGLGVIFLEESFTVRTAMPKHRLHAEAARGVLKSLLPDPGTDIKGATRSREELVELSGYESKPADFESLMRILDSELRLITPTDIPHATREGEPSPASSAERQGASQDGGCYYQLTHDYLVPSLREWLTRRLRESARGRAELRLQERSADWNRRPQPRHLPTWWEHLTIRTFTSRRDRTQDQQRMLGAAARRHSLQALIVLLAVALIGLGGRELNRRYKAAALLGQLRNANISQVPQIIDEIEPYRDLIDAELRKVIRNASDGAGSRSRTPELNASLALLPEDEGQLEYLRQRMLTARPDEFPVIRDQLMGYRRSLIEPLWQTVRDNSTDRGQRLRASMALATYQPPASDAANARWAEVSERVAAELVDELVVYPGHYPVVRDALYPARRPLLEPLRKMFAASADARRKGFATSLLAEYSADDPLFLTELLKEAAPEQFETLLSRLAPQPEVIAALSAELRTSVDPAPEAAKDETAKRRASAAIVLMRLGQTDPVWPRLKHGPDPRLRSYLIDRFFQCGIPPAILSRRLQAEREVSVRRALLLALGSYADLGMSIEEVELPVDQLLVSFRDEPDAGLHAAIDWTLRKWGYAEELEAIARELATSTVPTDRQWYVTPGGHTLRVFRGPIEFQMGTPPSDPERHETDKYGPQRIEHSFALDIKEVTCRQFDAFYQATRGKPFSFDRKFGEGPSCAQTQISWYQAAEFCNWLSDQEGLQPCYEPNDQGEFTEGMKVRADFLSRSGYRLPTSPEWEYACRADAITSRHYGHDPELLDRYAWYQKNSEEHAWPVGLLKPNDSGQFDMLGNVGEWCTEAVNDNRTPDRDEVVTEGTPRWVRGGWYAIGAIWQKDSFGQGNYPKSRGITMGMRIARTIPD